MTLQAQGSRGYGCMLLGSDEARIPFLYCSKAGQTPAL
jgi:hypothetical protein